VLRALPDGGFVGSIYSGDNVAHIFRADADGGNLRRVTSGSGEWFQDLAKDGTTLLFRRVDGLRELWSIPIEGGEARKIASDADQVLGYSSDSTQIAYLPPPEIEGRSDRVVLVVPASGGNPVARVTLSPRASHIQWVPESSAISYLAGESVRNLFRQPLAGGPAQQLTHFPEGQMNGYTWSQDGKSVLLSRVVNGLSNLWIATPERGEPRAVTDFLTGAVFQQAFTKDGKAIVFMYGNETQDAVLMKNFAE
jgi:Tol biopolymer transport system component